MNFVPTEKGKTMREKMIELIDAVLLYLPWGEVTPHTAADIADRIIDSGICDESKWIPVTERLPAYGEIVLAFGKYHATSGMFRGTSQTKPNWWHWRGNMYKEVSHWMPLPEPPKGE